MRRDQASALAGLSAAEIKKLLTNMKKIDAVLSRKAKLEQQLDKIDGELARLLAASEGPRKPGRRAKAKKRAVKKKATKKKTAKKKAAKQRAKKKMVRKVTKKRATKKKAAKKKVAKKKVAKKKVMAKAAKKRTTKKKIAKRKTTKRKTAKRKATAKKAAGRKVAKRRAAPTRRRGEPTLEQVVARLIRRNRGPLPFQEILKTITSEKLFASKSKNFDNVLRRTLSTSSAVKRVARGIYDLA